MTALALVLAAALAAEVEEPPTASPAPAADPEVPAVEPPPSPAPPAPEPVAPRPGEPPTSGAHDGPGAQVGPPAAGPAAGVVPGPPLPRGRSRTSEWSLGAGVAGARLMGVSSAGAAVRLATAVPGAGDRTGLLDVLPAFRPLVVVSGDLLVGETDAGLPVRAVSVTAGLWTRGWRLRAGLGLDLGVVAYRRATNGEWPMLLTAGLTAGAELAVLPLGRGELVVAARGSIATGPWSSGTLAVAYRGGTRPP